MYSAEEAIELGLIHQISSEESLTEEAIKVAQDFAKKDSAAFRSIKNLLRRPVANEMIQRENDSVREFVDIWYSDNTWENLKEIKIYS
jgi:enoyl-CoA hydratase/carnithine racemase